MILARKLGALAKEATVFEKFKLITSSIWNFLRPLIVLFLSEIGPILAKAAAAAVRSAAEARADQPGIVKREYARSIIVADLQRQGIEIGANLTESAVNAAIEAAVLGLKAEGK
jgi:hypothetical protein